MEALGSGKRGGCCLVSDGPEMSAVHGDGELA
jgi:hypothetical protein